MRGEIAYLNKFSKDQGQTNFYIDVNDIESFMKWSQNNPWFLDNNSYTVYLFRYQIRSYSDSRRRQNILKDSGITLLDDELPSKHRVFKSEIKRVFFQQTGNQAEDLSEFYTLVRLQHPNVFVNVISQNNVFGRIPLVNTYFFDPTTRTGTEIIPSQLDFLVDFNIHPQLRAAIISKIDEEHYGETIDEALSGLIDLVKTMSGLPGDGRGLMEQAFKKDGSNLKINSLPNPTNNNDTHTNEQRGYGDIYCGVMSGLRNPLAHNSKNGNFINSRYPDRKTLYKFLGFLSILYERVTHPLP